MFQQLFESGMSFEVFARDYHDANIERLFEVYSRIELDKEIANRIKSISNTIYILVFAELWDPDCIINLPAIKKLSDINSNIVFKILPKDGNEKYMEDYKLGGKVKIPTFVILDSEFKEIGVFIETPKVVKDVINRGNNVENIVVKRKYHKGEYVKDTIKEIVDTIYK